MGGGEKGTRVYRMGHQIFRKQDTMLPVIQNTVKEGLELHSESGRVTPVLGVLSARTRNGAEIMIAPDGAVIDHQKHGNRFRCG